MASTFYEHPIIITMTEKIDLSVRCPYRKERENRIISPLYQKNETSPMKKMSDCSSSTRNRDKKQHRDTLHL